jgi:uncharacterized protein (DUF1499 family)
MAILKAVVGGMPGAQLIEVRHDYLYAEFTSRLLGFVDDVEFWSPPDEKIIHVRSASRLGSGDMGVNRKRVEAIRARFAREKP